MKLFFFFLLHGLTVQAQELYTAKSFYYVGTAYESGPVFYVRHGAGLVKLETDRDLFIGDEPSDFSSLIQGSKTCMDCLYIHPIQERKDTLVARRNGKEIFVKIKASKYQAVGYELTSNSRLKLGIYKNSPHRGKAWIIRMGNIRNSIHR